ncbi:hypothetical protein I8752_12800 [Nostocaceae cyanobacterium CENA369]|uniref:Uncharacterized protein n=1 Tax=Dendronalium phyllosphericum CENA369 TaxID=1725256 RepID=A0A8J7I0R6_9NOST|nr:hypothetical protein [Dendronalium phyllosphericum]MBH8573884.1 hypothetical protein [Dendronalium phyllosphericum CENA369]
MVSLATQRLQALVRETTPKGRADRKVASSLVSSERTSKGQREKFLTP